MNLPSGKVSDRNLSIFRFQITELGLGFLATYLRITLGQSLGNSPGQPYVVEIWPPGHYSSIHDHGDACAVIKVCLLRAF